MEFLNNIWLALSVENEKLINVLLIPSSFIELYLVISLFLSFLDNKTSKKRKSVYIVCMAITTVILNIICPSPYNVFITYIITYFSTLLTFKLKPIPTLFGVLISLVAFTLVGSLFLNPYLKILNITYRQAEIVPIYRLLYLFITYTSMALIIFLVQKFKFCIRFFDKFSKKDKNNLYFNLILGLFTFLGQTLFLFKYIDNLSIAYTIFMFISLLSYFCISIYSLTRMAKLITTTLQLQTAEEYNKSLSVLYENIKEFKHDFDNIVSTISGYIDTDDINGLKEYFIKFENDCQKTNNIATLNPSIINNPGIYSLLNSKYHKADKLGIQINLDFFVNLDDFNIDTYEFSRILGILLDNAIEASSECEEKIINIKFRNEEKNSRHIVTISNTYKNKDLNIEEIFLKGITTKPNHSGLGLYEIHKYMKKNKNLNLFTTKSNRFFIQQLEIYYPAGLLSKTLLVIN